MSEPIPSQFPPTPSYKLLNQGVLQKNDELEFSIFSSQSSSIFFQLFSPDGKEVVQKIPLKKGKDCLWHGKMPLPESEMLYSYLIDDVEVNDPYAKSLSSPCEWLSGKYAPKGQFTFDHTGQDAFDWEGIVPCSIPFEEQIIYEMHVRGFTNDSSSKSEHKGTFIGMIDKIPYLKELGINTVELLPIFEFDERENPNTNPITGERLVNYWGYNTTNFFCPMKRYATSKDRLASIVEFKTLIRELHRAGLRVILDVVYNHVSSHMGLEKIDKGEYFILSEDGHHTNYTGCGNTIWANSDASINLIISSLRYFATEFHVDGFRFDLGGAMARGKDGAYLESVPIFDAIERDDILSTKFITAEPWDATSAEMMGRLGNSHISEWNGEYKNIVRQFLSQQNLHEESFARVFFGLGEIFTGGKPLSNQVHYVTNHDGFSLRDLVSFDHKHNEGNGEDNRDGENNNFSNNWGEEGATYNLEVKHQREKAMKNFLVANLTSHGIPMIKMGDEYGLSQEGNNNTFCQDSEISWFNWDQLENNLKQKEFLASLCHIRQKYIFRAKEIKPIYTKDARVIISFDDKMIVAFNMGQDPFDVTTTLQGEWDVRLTSMNTPSLLLQPNSSLIAICKSH